MGHRARGLLGARDAWRYFPHDHARSRAYRWGEDGLLGICDRQGRLCFALALWVNRKDTEGNNLFSGGFLGLDNIGVFDRSKPLPTGGNLEQADATAWMAFYSSTMLAIALELAAGDPAYEDVASKFFEHFVAIVDAMNHFGGSGLLLFHEYFHGDNGSGVGASHQTGWSALVARCIESVAQRRAENPAP